MFQRLFIITLLLNLLFSKAVLSAPGDILFSDDFERATLAPNWTTDVSTAAGISTATSNSPTRSMYTRHQAVSVTSSAIDLMVYGAEVSVWIRRGRDDFSEDPDPGEDLVVEYLDSVGGWNNLATYLGGGLNGEIYNANYVIPVDGLHANFQLRFRQLGGSGVDWDYWHIDDVIITEKATSRPPLAIGLCDDFEQGFSNWTINSSGGNAGINSATFQSPTSAMFTNGGTVTVTSNSIDTNTTQFSGFSVWIRRGLDGVSEDPDTGEDLVVEYLDNTLTWVTVGTFLGNGTPGQVYTPTYNLPASAQHNAFQVRFRQLAGNPGNGPFDFWHMDDVCIEGTTAFPVFVVQKNVTLEDDPVNITNPKAIPLSNSVYRVRVINTGIGSPDIGTLLVQDDIPAGVEMFTGNFSGGAPYSFTDGTGADASGVTCNFTSLPSTTDCITFLDAGSNPITPNGGYDPLVKSIEFRPAGIMNPSTGSNTPFFDLEFRVRVTAP